MEYDESVPRGEVMAQRQPIPEDFCEHGEFDEEAYLEANDAWEDYCEAKFEEQRDERWERENEDD